MKWIYLWGLQLMLLWYWSAVSKLVISRYPLWGKFPFSLSLGALQIIWMAFNCVWSHCNLLILRMSWCAHVPSPGPKPFQCNCLLFSSFRPCSVFPLWSIQPFFLCFFFFICFSCAPHPPPPSPPLSFFPFPLNPKENEKQNKTGKKKKMKAWWHK